MPQYYFHLSSWNGVERDEHGLELGSFELAYIEAHRAVHSIAAELIFRDLNPLEYTFQIMDSAQQMLTEVPFSEVLHSRRSPRPPKVHEMHRESRRQVERAHRLCREIARNEEALQATLAVTQAKLKELRDRIDNSRPASPLP